MRVLLCIDSLSLQKICYNGCIYKVSPRYESWDCVNLNSFPVKVLSQWLCTYGFSPVWVLGLRISRFLSCENFFTMVIHIWFLPCVCPYIYSKFPKTMQCFIQNHLKLCHNSNIYVASHLCFLMWCLKSLFPRKPHHNGCIDMASP